MGGKSRLLKHILPLIPEHTCYVEPFGGGLAVFLAKPKSKVEVINDINNDLINFYRIVRYHLEPLLGELEYLPRSREEFKTLIAQPGITDIQRAARWYYQNECCFGGKQGVHFGSSATQKGASRIAHMEDFLNLNTRLDGVYIENLHWEKVVKTYDRESTFFFLDPPYVGCSDAAYEAWSINDLRAMLSILKGVKGRWLLTINDTPEIRNIFDAYPQTPVARANGVNGAAGAGRVYRELIIQSEPWQPRAAAEFEQQLARPSGRRGQLRSVRGALV